MSQLSLPMTGRRVYEPARFLVHSGLRAFERQCRTELVQPRFVILYGVFGPRSGRSHFGVYLADWFHSTGGSVHCYEGAQFVEASRTQFDSLSLQNDSLLVVDRAEECLTDIPVGGSGPFVAAVEELRRKGVSVLMLSDRPITEFACDEHVLSRLKPALGEPIGGPADDEIVPLIQIMAAQRGFRFSERKCSYLAKRLGRSITDIDGYLERLDLLARSRGVSVGLGMLGEAL